MPLLILGIIPARGGSKGIPGKNIRPLAGRPLLAYAAEAARASGVMDRIILSTDSADIAAVGVEAGVEVPFLRPADLAQDTTPMLPVVEHALEFLATSGWLPDIIVLLQPTSPLRRPEQIRDAITLLETTGCDSVASVVELPLHQSPDYLMRIDDGRLVPFLADGHRVTRRQDVRPAFYRDGSVYAFRRATLVEQHSIYGRDCRPLVIPAEDSLTIDDPRDWLLAERRLAGARTL